MTLLRMPSSHLCGLRKVGYTPTRPRFSAYSTKRALMIFFPPLALLLNPKDNIESLSLREVESDL